jgi:hypothetical protein
MPHLHHQAWKPPVDEIRRLHSLTPARAAPPSMSVIAIFRQIAAPQGLRKVPFPFGTLLSACHLLEFRRDLLTETP